MIIGFIRLVFKSFPIFFFYIFHKNKNDVHSILAKRIREKMEQEGLLAIKFGQILSMRPDFVKQEYCLEFEKLLDSAPKVPIEKINKIFLSEFQKEKEKIFKEFDEVPVASASLAQVHRALTFDNQRVAVKILRPEINDKKIKKEFKTIELFSKIIIWAVNINKREYPILFSKLKEWIKSETDFHNEAKNIEIIRKQIWTRGAEIPRAFDEYSTKRILTMEYIEGYSLLDIIKQKRNGEVGDFDTDKIIKNLMDMAVSALESEYLHSDMHPANMKIIGRDKICLLDFGLIQRVEEEVRRGFILFMLGTVFYSPELMIRATKMVAEFSDGYDEKKLLRETSKICDAYRDAPASQMSNGEFLIKFLRICFNDKIYLPWSFMLYARVALQIDGVILNLDPNFVFAKYSRLGMLRIYLENCFKDVFSIPNFIDQAENIRDLISKSPEIINKILESIKV